MRWATVFGFAVLCSLMAVSGCGGTSNSQLKRLASRKRGDDGAAPAPKADIKPAPQAAPTAKPPSKAPLPVAEKTANAPPRPPTDADDPPAASPAVTADQKAVTPQVIAPPIDDAPATDKSPSLSLDKALAAIDPPMEKTSVASPATADLAPAATLPPLPRLTRSPVDATPGRVPVPDNEALAKSRQTFKEIYTEKPGKGTLPERLAFVKQLLNSAAKTDSSSADYYELLRIARDEAARAGDVGNALSACNLIEKRYDVEPLAMRLKVLQELRKAAKTLQPVEAALQEARRITRTAFDADRYDLALPAQDVWLEFARMIAAKAKPKTKGMVMVNKGPRFGVPSTPEEKALRRQVDQIEELGEQLEAAKELYATVREAAQTLASDGSNAAAWTTIGRYYCFVKNDWDTGLPYLARAADIKLRVLAATDLAHPRSPEETLSLADEYWQLATKTQPPLQRGLHLRAVYYYGVAATVTLGALDKAKAEKRIDEAANKYGRDEVNRLVPPTSGRRADT